MIMKLKENLHLYVSFQPWETSHNPFIRNNDRKAVNKL